MTDRAETCKQTVIFNKNGIGHRKLSSEEYQVG